MTANDPRSADAADVPAITALTRAAYAKYVSRIGRAPMPMTADHAVPVAAGHVWVIDDEDGPVAVLTAFPDGNALLIENVAVHPDRQGAGLGRRLMTLAEDLALAAGLPAVKLYTNVAMVENIAFYGRLGYLEYDRREEAGFARVYMRKLLS